MIKQRAINMENDFLSVKNKELSEVRRKKFEANIREVFDRTGLARKLVKVASIVDDPEEKFVKLGLAIVADKVWFVDDPGEGVYYSYESLGYEYGKSLAEGEARLIIDNIMASIKQESTVKVNERIEAKDIAGVFRSPFGSKGIDLLNGDLVIVTNLYDESDFWYIEEFKGDRSEGFGFGTLNICGEKIPVHYSRLVPKGLTFVIDRSKIGTLFIKRPLEITVESIAKVSKEKKDEILKSIPSLNPEKLDEKVSILVEEVVRFELEDPNAVVILQKENSGDRTGK